MAHKTLIGGTAYEISGGKTLIDGTAYEISGGKTVIDETVRDIDFQSGHKIHLHPWGNCHDFAWIRIGDTDYYIDQPTEITVADGTPIECMILCSLPSNNSSHNRFNGKIYVNKNLVAEKTGSATQNRWLTYTHIVDSQTYIFLGTNDYQSGNTDLISLADDGFILFIIINEPIMTVNGKTWEEYIDENNANLSYDENGQVYLRMGTVSKPLGYPDGTVVNSKDRILPLQYGAIW